MATLDQQLNIGIENFRSIRRTTLPLHPGINILIGPNGSGKTCLLSALKFLRHLLLDGVSLAMAKNGGPARNYHRGESVIRFFVDHDYGRRIYRRRPRQFRFSWSISIAQSGREHIASVIHENLEIYIPSGKKRIFVLKATVDRQNNNQPITSFNLGKANNFGRDVFLDPGEIRPRASKGRILSRQQDFWDQVMGEITLTADYSFLPYMARTNDALFAFVRQLVNLEEFDIIPDAAREATNQMPVAEMLPTGAGLSEVIYALKNRHYHRLGSSLAYESSRFGILNPIVKNFAGKIVAPPSFFRFGQYRDLTKILTKVTSEFSLAVDSLTGIGTGIDEKTGKRFLLFESDGHSFYPEEISDGTIKWLCILVSIFVSRWTIYLLEEPENFLHPWMQQHLLKLMREQDHSSEAIYVLTTHSATILNAARTQEVTTVVRDETGTQAKRAEDIESIATVLEQSDFGLGDLWVSGVLGGVPAGND